MTEYCSDLKIKFKERNYVQKLVQEELRFFFKVISTTSNDLVRFRLALDVCEGVSVKGDESSVPSSLDSFGIGSFTGISFLPSANLTLCVSFFIPQLSRS